jgi:hypothetical protein
MERLIFKQLPLVIKVAVWIAFFNAWLSLEEFVINRQGLWKYMPFYNVADPCVWDLVVALIITVGLWRASRRGKSLSE